MWLLRPGLTFEEVVIRIIAILLIVFLILPLHECAHGLVACKLGDPTAKNMGRLTLNPLVHFDALGSVGILLFGFGWAKPVPIDARNFKNPRRDMAITAAAGPLSNIMAAIVGAFVINFIRAFGAGNALWINILLNNYVLINVGLAVFNLIPLIPLDGSKIIEAFIPEKILVKYYQNARVITMIVFFMLLFGFLSVPLAFLQNVLYDFIIKITAMPFGL